MGTMQSGVTSPSYVTSPSNEVADSISQNSSGKLSLTKLEAALSKIHNQNQNQIMKPPVTVANTQQTKTYAEALQLNPDGNIQNTTATFQQTQSQSIVTAPKEVLPLSRKISRFEISVVKEAGISQTNQQQSQATKMSPGLSPAKSVKDAKSSTTTLVTMTDGSTSTSMLNKTNSAASQTVLSESDASVAIGGDGNDDIISTYSDGSNMHITNINANNVDPETMKYWTNLKERKTSSDSFCSTNSDIEEFQRQQQQLIYQQHIMQTQQQQMHQQQQQLQQQQQQQIQQLQQQQIPIQQQQQMNQQQHVQQQTSAIIQQQQLFPQQPQLRFDPLMTSVRSLVRKMYCFYSQLLISLILNYMK